MTGCRRGCTLLGLHQPDCGCTRECPDHDDHCRGCLPKPAVIGGFCQHCGIQLRDTIDALPPCITALHRMPGGRLAPPDQPTGDPTRRATKVDQISPSPAHDAADDAARWLHSWATAVADELSERGPFEYRTDGVPVPDAWAEARYLNARLPHITTQSYANDIAEEAEQLLRTLTLITGTDDADQRIPTRCPSCNQRTLVRPNGEEYVTCRNRHCASVWQSDHFGILAKVVTA
ncbi:hypothetical protein [Terrabacter terrigena]|uniref:Uncharacterized protein n=1 Tax=Terrabacter terrigena TaxID=574718 RepID=A0ABW3N234_9MICO